VFWLYAAILVCVWTAMRRQNLFLAYFEKYSLREENLQGTGEQVPWSGCKAMLTKGQHQTSC